jgi:hypothetical protein
MRLKVDADTPSDAASSRPLFGLVQGKHPL